MDELGSRWAITSFNAYQLKLIAIIAMVADHIGAVFFPQVFILRMVGRLTAPIMAFFIAEGYRKTRNVMKYMLRLFIFALISMLPYALVFKHSPFNILFDLLLGLLVIEFTHKMKEDYQKWLIVALGAAIAVLLRTDGWLGISTLVYLFFRFREDRKALILATATLYLGVLLSFAGYSLLTGQMGWIKSYPFWLRPLSLLSLVFLFKYNGEKGKNLKYLFYSFYPGHLLLIYILMRVL